MHSSLFTSVLLAASAQAAHVHLRDIKAAQEYRGDTACTSGNYCKVINEWYSQCQPGGQSEVGVWGQCGGKNYNGATKCTSGNTCKVWNEWNSQCVPSNDQPATAPLNWAQVDGYTCAGNTDFYGSDIGQAQTRFDRCLDECDYYESGGHKCNAFMWVRNPGSEFGICYFKSFDDFNRKPSTSWLGGISCKRNPKYMQH
ncbi:hypothetical protein SPRG_21136 [Saprolegnia parasitica CBS 223.65]|uniref:CBM1 domain-containing protein n=1 Tax=Saprolegnia parasitica (strain CBS 223.65) TaxID=695850 RepID=A0A067BVF1_SAPPC|nr:hypothetical protein SPRG_21136 [Saprolegnia parasitica CBS 223.65]KDO22223.1 hypothetical protein SPRG_21136 [Saprolegnia parasitica CBS 223.65]|eukprot:XP_012207086.1 hypothetical protein SPRG_21136 [Saprolegnia parasitica CBS 223.65]